MDPEELWRQALQEFRHSTAHNAHAHGSRNQPVVHAVAEEEGEDEEDYDAELLRSAPCAFDAAPAPPADAFMAFPSSPLPPLSLVQQDKGMWRSASPHQQQQQQLHRHEQEGRACPDGSSQHAQQKGGSDHRTAGHGSVEATVVLNTDSNRKEREAGRPRGVRAQPPEHGQSFLLKGDAGTVRWVTVSGHTRPSSSGRHQSHEGGGGEWLQHTEGNDSGPSVLDADDGSSQGEDDPMSLSSASRAYAREGGGLLGRDGRIEDLLEKIRAEQRREAERQHQLQQDRAIDEEFGLAALPKATRSAVPKTKHLTQDSEGGGELWVTKYTPKHFRDVLSDESVNLQLLRWLKSWDHYVFGPAPTMAAAGAASGHKMGSPSRQGGALAGEKHSLGLDANRAAAAAAAQPPEDRMAVLVGPPGVGKTTLVHVLAAHCGYEVIEINASVERTYGRLESIIKTAVTAPSAPGTHAKRARPPSESNVQGGTALWEASRSLVDHLLTPKCLVIDEMDGIQSNVAHLLLSLDIHRPVFCMCNDLYVPALRPLRSRVNLVYQLPPIRPQRLLSRLEEICLKEGLPMESAALAEMVRRSHGDVRSCLNSLQFLHRGVRLLAGHSSSTSGDGVGSAGVTNHLPPFSSSASASAPTPTTSLSAAAVQEMFRRMQSKDTTRDIWESWAAVFTRAERAKSVQLLKKECGYDYDTIVGAASAQGRRYQTAQALRRKRARAGVVDRPDELVEEGADGVAPRDGEGRHDGDGVAGANGFGQHVGQPVFGFRVDPAYIYASHLLSGGGAGVAEVSDSSSASTAGTAGRAFLSGLQENYLRRPYTDYTFRQTSGAADGFAFQDRLSSLAFSSSGGGGVLMHFAERYESVTALTVFACCSSSARGEKLRYPREDAAARQQLVEAQHVTRDFRDGCHVAQSCPFMWCDEGVASEFCPLLLRTLFDGHLRLPLRPISTVTALPAADQALLRHAVERHAAYRLSYKRAMMASLAAPQRQQLTLHGGGGGWGTGWGSRAAPRHAPFSRGGHTGGSHGIGDGETERAEVWVLTPAIDQLGGVAGPVFSGRGDGVARYGRMAPLQGNTNPMSTAVATLPAGRQGGGGGGARLQPLPAITDDLKELLVGEIKRHDIVSRAEEALRGKGRKGSAAPVGSSGGGDRPFSPPRGHTAEGNGTKENEDSREPACKRQKTDEKHVALTHTAPAPQPPTPTTAGAAAGPRWMPTRATPPPAAPARRDFFGRVIHPKRGGDSSSSPSAAAQQAHDGARQPRAGATRQALSSSPQPQRGQRAHPQHSLVKYVYQDGSTNAVKMPAALADF